MYFCEKCKNEFYEPEKVHTSYEFELGLLSDFTSTTPYEYNVCPYCQSKNFKEKGVDDMKREIIDLNEVDMTFDEIDNLENYIWKNDQLIPTEMIEGE